MREKALVVCIVCFSLLFAAIFAELFLRVTESATTYTEKIHGRYQTPYALHPVTNDPNIDCTIPFKRDNFLYHLKTNSEGLRDREHPLKKEPGQYRILALGDSFTEGVGASLDETWPKQLEKLLNERGLPVQASVISGGRAGSDPALCYRRLTERLLKYRPDMVILATNTSDYNDLAVRGSAYMGKGGLVAPRGEFLWRHSHLFRLFAMGILKWNAFLMPPKKWRQMEEAAKELFVDFHKKFARLGQEEGFWFVHIHHPYPFELGKDDIFDSSYLTGRQDLEIADIKPCMEKGLDLAGPPEDYSLKHDGHYNAKGYRQFALCVMEVLEAAGLPGKLQQPGP
ncbi:MAG: GDSL-type esterase/lipase family protein [Desulfatibacillaceae bacterium]|nr:GDSL-type esterase/lipase family protein [Desulfatibacillaceae bacterium]